MNCNFPTETMTANAMFETGCKDSLEKIFYIMNMI